MKNTNEIVRRKIVKNGSRGTGFDTLLATARTSSKSFGPAKLKTTLKKIGAYQTRKGFYSLA